MKDFHLCGWLLSYDFSKISAKLVISLIRNKVFAKFFEIMLRNNVTSSHTPRKFYIWDGMSTIKCLFWNANDSIVKLMVSITIGVSLWYRPCYKNMLNDDNDNWFSLIVEQILAFPSNTYLVRKVRSLPPNFKRIA